LLRAHQCEPLKTLGALPTDCALDRALVPRSCTVAGDRRSTAAATAVWRTACTACGRASTGRPELSAGGTAPRRPCRCPGGAGRPIRCRTAPAGRSRRVRRTSLRPGVAPRSRSRRSHRRGPRRSEPGPTVPSPMARSVNTSTAPWARAGTAARRQHSVCRRGTFWADTSRGRNRARLRTNATKGELHYVRT